MDKEGKPYCVRYEQIDAMLLNEFLKEHKKKRNSSKRPSRSNRKAFNHSWRSRISKLDL